MFAIDQLNLIVDSSYSVYNHQRSWLFHELTSNRLCKNILHLFGCKDMLKSDKQSRYKFFFVVELNFYILCPFIDTPLILDCMGGSVVKQQ